MIPSWNQTPIVSNRLVTHYHIKRLLYINKNLKVAGFFQPSVAPTVLYFGVHSSSILRLLFIYFFTVLSET